MRKKVCGIAILGMAVLMLAACGSSEQADNLPTEVPTRAATETLAPTVAAPTDVSATATPEPTSTPTPSPEPTATPTPEPTATATPEPTATPTPEPTATPSPSPTATPTPAPTATPTPSPSPTSTPTPRPTATPTPSDDELKVVTNLLDVPVYATWTDESYYLYSDVIDEIKAGNIEKVKYVCSTGEEFRIWNIRLVEDFGTGQVYCWWFLAPQGKEFSSGYSYCNWSTYLSMIIDGTDIINLESNIKSMEESALLQSEHFNEEYAQARIGYVSSLPRYPVYSKAAECPVELHTIVQEGDTIYFWYESEDRDYLCGGGNCTWCKLWEAAEQQANETFGYRVFWQQADGPVIWNGKYYYRSVFVAYDWQ